MFKVTLPLRIIFKLKLSGAVAGRRANQRLNNMLVKAILDIYIYICSYIFSTIKKESGGILNLLFLSAQDGVWSWERVEVKCKWKLIGVSHFGRDILFTRYKI